VTSLDEGVGTGMPETANPQGAPRRPLLARIPDTAPLVVLLIAMVVFFSLRSEFFLNYDNFLNILTAMAIAGIIAAPATLLLVAGQFDLSVGSALTFCGVVMAYVT